MTTASRSARPSGSASSSASSPEAGARGRPRDPAVDQRIRDAALQVLAQSGFSQLSVDAICLRAGVPRSTFYRRWSGVPEVVADAFHAAARIDPLPDTGSLLGDLTAYAERLARLFADPVFGACVSFLSAEARLRPDLRQRLQRDLAVRRAANLGLFDRAAARGEAWAQIAPDLVFDVINGLAMTAGGDGPRPADYALVLRRLLGEDR